VLRVITRFNEGASSWAIVGVNYTATEISREGTARFGAHLAFVGIPWGASYLRNRCNCGIRAIVGGKGLAVTRAGCARIIARDKKDEG
jgi:hypothetical protein